MVKFGEDLERAIFPIWRSYYLDYARLKRVLEFVRETYPYLDLLAKHDVIVLNDSARPFEMVMSGAIFSFVAVDGTTMRNCRLRIVMHKGSLRGGGPRVDVAMESTAVATPLGDRALMGSAGGREVDGASPESLTPFASAKDAASRERALAVALQEGFSPFIDLDEARAALLTDDVDLSAKHTAPSCLKPYSKGYALRMRERYVKDLASLKIGKEIADSVGGVVMTLFLDGSSAAKAKSLTPRVAAPDPEDLPANGPGGVAGVVKDLASLVGGVTAEQREEVRVKREEAKSVPKAFKILGAALEGRPTTMSMLMPAAVAPMYRNPTLAHALYCYHLEVSNVLSRALKEEIDRVSNFYISQSHVICGTALLCADGAKMWRELSAKDRSQIRIAFRQTYSTLDMLQQFCDMNCLAVGKILKKFDKRTHQQMLTDYKHTLENLVFKMGHDSRIHRLQKVLNATFSRHVMKGDHKQGLSYLDSRDTVSGRATELSLAVLVGIVGTMAIVLFGHLFTMGITDEVGVFPPESRAAKYGVYLIFIPWIIALWAFLFSINVMVWEYFGINFAFMFDLDPIFHWTGTELMRDSLMYILAWMLCVYQFLLWNTHEALCVTTWDLYGSPSAGGTPTTVPPMTVMSSLNATAAQQQQYYFAAQEESASFVNSTVATTTAAAAAAATFYDNTTISPLYWVFPIWAVIFVCKATFNNFFFNNRKPWIAITMWRILTTPYYQVKFSEFIICNNVASLGGWFFEMTFYWCPMWGSEADAVCAKLRGQHFAALTVIPPFWRLLQCFRRYYDQPKATRQPFPNLINAGKYTAACAAVLAWNYYYAVKYNGSYSSDAQLDLLFAWVVGIQIFAQIYKYAWDIVVDAGIWIRHDDGVWRLREEKVYGVWWPYIVFCIVNIPLTSTWAIKFAVAPYTKGKSYMWVVWSSIEVCRRCYWNFMRVENEHVNNTEGYRATRFAPIPAKRIVAWDAMADDLTERFLRTDKDQSSGEEFPTIKGINFTGVTKFFANLPGAEQVAILQSLSAKSGGRDAAPLSAAAMTAAKEAAAAANNNNTIQSVLSDSDSGGGGVVGSNVINGAVDGHVFYDGVASHVTITTVGTDGVQYATHLPILDANSTDGATGGSSVIYSNRPKAGTTAVPMPPLTSSGNGGGALSPNVALVDLAKFFSELPEEIKVCLVLEHLGVDETMNAYLGRIRGGSSIIARVEMEKAAAEKRAAAKKKAAKEERKRLTNPAVGGGGAKAPSSPAKSTGGGGNSSTSAAIGGAKIAPLSPSKVASAPHSAADPLAPPAAAHTGSMVSVSSASPPSSTTASQQQSSSSHHFTHKLHMLASTVPNAEDRAAEEMVVLMGVAGDGATLTTSAHVEGEPASPNAGQNSSDGDLESSDGGGVDGDNDATTTVHRIPSLSPGAMLAMAFSTHQDGEANATVDAVLSPAGAAIDASVAVPLQQQEQQGGHSSGIEMAPPPTQPALADVSSSTTIDT